MIQYQNIHDNNLILMYKGMLTFDLLSAIIGSVERRINEFETERRVQKKFIRYSQNASRTCTTTWKMERKKINLSNQNPCLL